ncbi:unnamed protein product [Lota lota]
MPCHKCKQQGHYASECDSQEERRREEEQQAATEPASGSEDMFESGEEQRQQDEDNDYADATLQEGDGDAGVASRGQTIPSTIGSSMDGVSCKVGCSTEGTPEESAMDYGQWHDAATDNKHRYRKGNDYDQVHGQWQRECAPESIERGNVSVTEEGDFVDSEEEEPEDSDEDVMQTEGDPDDEPEKEADTLVERSQGQGLLIDIALENTLDDVWPEWSASGEETSGEQASQVTNPTDETLSTGSLGDKQGGDEEGDGEESESWIADMLFENVSEKERDNQPQMEQKAEEATKKRKAALQAEVKKKKDQRRNK